MKSLILLILMISNLASAQRMGIILGPDSLRGVGKEKVLTYCHMSSGEVFEVQNEAECCEEMGGMGTSTTFGYEEEECE